MIKTYSELIKYPSFIERYEYLMLKSRVGEMTFNGHRCLNQKLYQLPEWKSVRRNVIIRDSGCDLACEGHEIVYGPIFVHHLNPITIDDIIQRKLSVFDMENLICVSKNTHNAIHFGNDNLILEEINVRKKNDTCLWR